MSQIAASHAGGNESVRLGRRYLEAVGFVVVWMAIGVGLRWTKRDPIVIANAYLLIGIPLMILFQRYLRKKPLVSLWRRDAERFRIGIVGSLIAVGFAAMPAYGLATVALPKSSVVLALYFSAAIVGAFGVAFTMWTTTLRELRDGMPGFVVASAIGITYMLLSVAGQGKPLAPLLVKMPLFARWFLLYFPICFCIEEVVFRGMLDAHVQPQPTSGSSAWLSAIAISCLWGLWHLPIVPFPSPAAAIVIVPIACFVHISIGLPLSFCWRSSGSLFLPAAAHALIDAVRNTVLS